MRYLAEMLGQEFVWSPFRRWGRGEGGRVAVASMSVSRRVDRVPAQDHFLFGAPEQEQWRGEICTEYWPCGNEKIMVGIHDKAPVQPCKEPDYFLLFFQSYKETNPPGRLIAKSLETGIVHPRKELLPHFLLTTMLREVLVT